MDGRKKKSEYLTTDVLTRKSEAEEKVDKPPSIQDLFGKTSAPATAQEKHPDKKRKDKGMKEKGAVNYYHKEVKKKESDNKNKFNNFKGRNNKRKVNKYT